MRPLRYVFLAMVALALLGSFAVLLELGLRAFHGELFGSDEPRPTRYPQGFQYDAFLGHTPRPGARFESAGWTYSIDADGLRRNGGAEPTREGPAILATGDSFTFGDEVEDQETWPARLEHHLGRPVLNGGVSGYGFDQAVLRAEKLLAEHEPELVIVALNSGDIRRCEMSLRNKWKPYFDVVDGNLELRNVPVPTEIPARGSFERAVRSSFLAGFVLRRMAPVWWYLEVRIEHDRGDDVARLLADRLAAAVREQGAELLFVTLAGLERDASRLPGFVRHVRGIGVPVLHLAEEIVAMPASAFQRYGHLAPGTNDWVARRIAAHLRQGGSRATSGSRTPPVSSEPRARPRLHEHVIDARRQRGSC